MLRFKPTLIDINDESTLLELEQAEEKRKKKLETSFDSSKISKNLFPITVTTPPKSAAERIGATSTRKRKN